MKQKLSLIFYYVKSEGFDYLLCYFNRTGRGRKRHHEIYGKKLVVMILVKIFHRLFIVFPAFILTLSYLHSNTMNIKSIFNLSVNCMNAPISKLLYLKTHIENITDKV